MASVRSSVVAITCCAATICTAALGLLGWFTGRTLLGSVRPEYIPMAPSTVVLFCIASCGLVLRLLARSPISRKIWAGAGVLVAAVGASKLAEFFLGVLPPFDMEALMVRSPGTFGAVSPARMSPVTAAIFVLTGMALLSIGVDSSTNGSPARRRLSDLGGAGSALIVFAGFTVVLGYLYAAPLLYASWVTPVALPTGVGFLCLGGALIAAGGPGRFPLRSFCGSSARARLLRGFLPATVAAFLISEVANHAFLTRFGINAALLSALSALLFAGLLTLIISILSRLIGGQIDSAQAVLKQSQEEMESRVRERTTELAAINASLEAEVLEREAAERHAQKARLVAEEATRAKSAFLAGMSHELRTPLNSIIGFSEILEDKTFGDLNDRQTTYVGHVLSSGRHLLQLINDILDLSKIESGRPTLDREPFSAAATLDEVATIVKSLAAKKSIKLQVRAEAGLPELVADQPKFKQILYNLLSNAIKFTPESGDVKVHAAMRLKAGASGKQAPWLRIAVSDTGIGVKPEDQERIFNEFEQVDSSYTRQQQGTGLGLALARSLVELHGGRIWVESDGVPGRGSTFLFELPIELAAERAVETQGNVSTPTIARRRGDERPLVLVVEDEPHARELLTLYLTEVGYAVDHASDGALALRKIRELRPEVVTLDIMLPRKDGFSVLADLKSLQATKDIPVVIVSITENCQLAFSLGAEDFLVKPVERERLLEAVRKAASRVERRPVAVLVVDDDPKTVEYLTALLEDHGYRVVKAYGGREGIDLAMERMPDVIILDLVMPDVTGFEVIRRLREHPLACDIPILVFTAQDLTEEDRRQLMPIHGIVPKSAKEELLRELEKVVRRCAVADAG